MARNTERYTVKRISTLRVMIYDRQAGYGFGSFGTRAHALKAIAMLENGEDWGAYMMACWRGDAQ